MVLWLPPPTPAPLARLKKHGVHLPERVRPQPPLSLCVPHSAGAAEQLILNRHLTRLVTYTRMSAFQRFVQQVRLRGLYIRTSKAIVLQFFVGLTGWASAPQARQGAPQTSRSCMLYNLSNSCCGVEARRACAGRSRRPPAGV
eukprot:358164-Chlamydomonas_euryale.AAC.11